MWGAPDAITKAIQETVAPIAHLEKEWDQQKLTTTLCQYFRTAADGLALEKRPWEETVHQYCDNVLGTIFQVLSDRSWLNEADWVVPLDASIRVLFPQLCAEVAPEVFERTLLHSHDKAFEAQRYAVILWEVLGPLVKEPRNKKVVSDALEWSRQAAVAELYRCYEKDGDPGSVEPFVERWVKGSVERLSAEYGGWLTNAMSKDTAVQLFSSLVEAGTLPVLLLANTGPPPRPWPFVADCVRRCWTQSWGVGEGDGGGQWKWWGTGKRKAGKAAGDAFAWGGGGGGWEQGKPAGLPISAGAALGAGGWGPWDDSWWPGGGCGGGGGKRKWAEVAGAGGGLV